MSQSNTHEGDLLIAANEDLSSTADVLVAPYNSSGQLVVTRPAANNDYGGLRAGLWRGLRRPATVRPLESEPLGARHGEGHGQSGRPAVLADGVTTAADKGKVRKVPATTGTYRLVGDRRGGVRRRPAGEMRPTFGTRHGLITTRSSTTATEKSICLVYLQLLPVRC